MFRGQRRVPIGDILRISAAAGLGLAAGFLLSRWGRFAPRVRALAELENGTVDLLLGDPHLSQRPIEVEALSDGIVELTGTVRDMEEVHRAVELAQRVPGVRTVLNRLDVEILGAHLEATRRRSAAGDADLASRRWYGIGIGMGRRRQGDDTDPDRPDDKVPIVSRELGVNKAEDGAADEIGKLASGIEGHSTGLAGPMDHGRAEQDTQNPEDDPPDPFRNRRADSGVHRPAKKGTEVTLEESGVRRRPPPSEGEE